MDTWQPLPQETLVPKQTVTLSSTEIQKTAPPPAVNYFAICTGTWQLSFRHADDSKSAFSDLITVADFTAETDWCHRLNKSRLKLAGVDKKP